MSAAAPTKEPKKGGPPLLVPPEERFWKRYSPHGEAPLSMAGSFGLHLLVVGGLLLFGAYLASLFIDSTANLPVTPVRLAIPGGGGGSKHGVGEGKGVGVGPEITEQADPGKENVPGELDAPPRVNLNPVEKVKLEQNFDKEAVRYIADRKSEMGRRFANLDDKVRNKLADGLRPGKGEGGSGSGGGKGTGEGTGEGPGKGPGKAKLSIREKRMLRWQMQFTANTGPEYLGQLRQLGAILGIPAGEGNPPAYKVVRDLVPGGKLRDEDLSKIQRIYWIDDRPSSVRDILGALGLNLPRVPNHFVAFMPEKLEAELYQMERAYVENVLRKPFVEDKVDETQFKVVRGLDGRYKPELIRVTMRP